MRNPYVDYEEAEEAICLSMVKSCGGLRRSRVIASEVRTNKNKKGKVEKSLSVMQTEYKLILQGMYSSGNLLD